MATVDKHRDRVVLARMSWKRILARDFSAVPPTRTGAHVPRTGSQVGQGAQRQRACVGVQCSAVQSCDDERVLSCTGVEEFTPAEYRTVAVSGNCRRQLLVVDDNEVNRIVVSAQLKLVGLDPDEAEDGLRAVEIAKHADFDLILMDVQLPTLDRIGATRQIGTIDRCRNIPIIALPADAFKADRQRVMEAGMSDHLAKPLQARQLYAALAQWLAPSRHPTEDSRGDP
jgi:CheY-like chemotaxis protein